MEEEAKLLQEQWKEAGGEQSDTPSPNAFLPKGIA